MLHRHRVQEGPGERYFGDFADPVISECTEFEVSKSSPIPSTPSLHLMHVSDEETVVDVPFREIVCNLMWITNQTGPDISNAVRAIARFSHDPKPIHDKVAQKIRVSECHVGFRANIQEE